MDFTINKSICVRMGYRGYNRVFKGSYNFILILYLIIVLLYNVIFFIFFCPSNARLYPLLPAALNCNCQEKCRNPHSESVNRPQLDRLAFRPEFAESDAKGPFPPLQLALKPLLPVPESELFPLAWISPCKSPSPSRTESSVCCSIVDKEDNCPCLCALLDAITDCKNEFKSSNPKLIRRSSSVNWRCVRSCRHFSFKRAWKISEIAVSLWGRRRGLGKRRRAEITWRVKGVRGKCKENDLLMNEYEYESFYRV